MNGTASPGQGRPMSTKELAALAEDFKFQENIPFKYWARTADTLYQEAGFAIEDGDLRKAYQMLWRHSILVLQHLRSHPEAKLPASKAAAKPLRERQNQEVFKRLEELKPVINADYEEWKMMSDSKSKADLEQEDSKPPSYESYAARDPTLTGASKILDVGENQELAVDLAQNDYKRRDAARRGTRQAGVSEEEEQERRKGGRWDGWDRQDSVIATGEDDDFRKQMEATRQRLEDNREGRDDVSFSPVVSPPERPRPFSPVRAAPQAYHYPSVARSQPIQWDASPLEPSRPGQSLPPPSKPPKELERHREPAQLAPPPKPEKERPLSYKPLPKLEARPDGPERPSKESLDEPKPPKKQRITFRPSAYLENGEALRSIFIPRQLRKDFLRIAGDNTRRGLEMCGMLLGRPVNNALFVSCLLIPEQTCTSDTCETENESDMFDYCIQEDLMMLGWIHTHPTQTCFMSSRDLHTQAGYQVMMKESIAIVCAPRFEPSYGIFRLTNPPGLPHILNCKKPETFHTHDVDNIYTKAGHPPGHVYESDQLSFYVHDLRPNK